VILTALFNWKGFWGRGKLLSSVAVALWAVYFIVSPMIFERHFLYPLEENQGQAVLAILILILAMPLVFLTTEYLPYIKGTRDVQATEKMVKQARNFCIILVFVIGVFVILVAEYIFA
jgi:hypothetical protein